MTLFDRSTAPRGPLSHIPTCEKIRERYIDLSDLEIIWEKKIASSVEDINSKVEGFFSGKDDQVREVVIVCNSPREQDYITGRFKERGYIVIAEPPKPVPMSGPFYPTRVTW